MLDWWTNAANRPWGCPEAVLLLLLLLVLQTKRALLGMETANIRRMRAICGGDPENKIHRLLDGAPNPRDIADPWYTGDFDAACRDITEGCARLIDRLAEGRDAY